MLGRVRSGIFFSFFLVVLVGCAGVPEVRYDKSASDVSEIALLRIGFPSEASAYDTNRVQNTTGAVGGLIGSLIGAAIDSSRESSRNQKLRGLISDRNLNARSVFREALVEALQAKGYAVRTVPVGNPSRTDYAELQPGDVSGADAVLDVATIRYGFIQKGGAWRPYMTTKARLTSLSDGTVLMENLFTYNDVSRSGRNLALVPSGNYVWSEFGSVLSDPDGVVTSIEDALRRSAERIAGQL